MVLLGFQLFCYSQEVVLVGGTSSNDLVSALSSLDPDGIGPLEPRGTITMKGNIVIDSDVVIPKDVVLRFFKDAKFVFLDSTNTVHFEQCFIDAGKFQIFDLSVFDNTINNSSLYNQEFTRKVSMITGKFNNENVYPEWFGGFSYNNSGINDHRKDDSFAFQLAINTTGDKVKLSRGIYYIYNTISKERDSVKNAVGIKLIGVGKGKIKDADFVLGGTQIRVRGNAENFIKIKGRDGTESNDYYKPIEGTLLEGFSLLAQTPENKNGIYFYSASYNYVKDVEISNFKESGIVFDGNPNINPDYTASVFTKIINCKIKHNKIGIFNKINNNSPLLTLNNSFIVNNLETGIIWNSSYFRAIDSSISFNGRKSNPNSKGGFYNNFQDNYPAFFGAYVSKGIVIETTELDTNYPSSVTLKSSKGARISNCSIQFSDQYGLGNNIADDGIICVGGETKNINGASYFERSRGTLIEGNSIKFTKTMASTTIEPTASMIKLSDGALYTVIENNCFNSSQINLDTTITPISNLGTDYFFIKEDLKTGVNKVNFHYEGAYVKLLGTQCVNPKIDINGESDLDRGFDLVFTKSKKTKLWRLCSKV